VKECNLSWETPDIEGGGLCLITAGLDPEVADATRQVALQESFRFLTASPDYIPNLNAQLAQQLQGAEG
jgi:hypothetical protein